MHTVRKVVGEAQRAPQLAQLPPDSVALEEGHAK